MKRVLLTGGSGDRLRGLIENRLKLLAQIGIRSIFLYAKRSMIIMGFMILDLSLRERYQKRWPDPDFSIFQRIRINYS